MSRQVRTKEQIAYDTEAQAKRCNKCGDRKPFDDFYNDKKTVDGKTGYCKACTNTRATTWTKANKEALVKKRRRSAYKVKYGITIEDYDKMIEVQDNRCDICGVSFDDYYEDSYKRFASVDHDHDTGKVRGLLCNDCNVGLGNMKEDVAVMEAAIKYIKKHKEI